MPTPTKKQKLLDAGLLKPDADAALVDRMLKYLSHNDIDEIIRVLGSSNFVEEPVPISIVPDPDPVGAAERLAKKSKKKRKKQK